MGLQERERRALMARAHHLKPVVLVGQKGLHPSVIEEIRNALDHHELIKIKIPGAKDAADPAIRQILSETGAEFIQRVGGITTLYLKKA